MKIRTDFVTNSSSSSFTLEIEFNLKRGNQIYFCAHGGNDGERIDYFDNEVLVTVSPKELATAETVEKMIKLLTDGVRDDDWDERPKIFVKSNSKKSDTGLAMPDAYNFIERIRAGIKSMDDIESITITGDEENYVSYRRSFSYNRITGKYTGIVDGEEFEKDGSSGGDLMFDISDCEIRRIDEPNPDRIAAYYDPDEANQNKLFYIKYDNPLLVAILKKYNYKSKKFDDATNIEALQKIIPNYAGVESIEALTTTLINVLIAFGKGENGFDNELKNKVDEIAKSFSIIEGTIVETYTEDGLADGYDFELKNGIFKATYRACEDGW